MGVIVQEYGPIYGEPVNGTVQGRPNGSVYIPSSNTIDLSTIMDTIYVRLNNEKTNIYTCNATGTGVGNSFTAVAVAQDLSSYLRLEIGTTDTFEVSVGRNVVAGNFNYTFERFAQNLTEDEFPIVNGETYYLRVVLMASTNEPVAVSQVYEATGWSA